MDPKLATTLALVGWGVSAVLVYVVYLLTVRKEKRALDQRVKNLRAVLLEEFQYNGHTLYLAWKNFEDARWKPIEFLCSLSFKHYEILLDQIVTLGPDDVRKITDAYFATVNLQRHSEMPEAENRIGKAWIKEVYDKVESALRCLPNGDSAVRDIELHSTQNVFDTTMES